MQEELVQAYLGEEYDDIISHTPKLRGKAGALGFLFGPVLFFYYRSYLVAFGLLFAQGIVTYIASLINEHLSKNMSYVYAALYAMYTYPIYLWDVRRKMNNLAEKNSTSSKSDLIAMAMCKKRHSVLAVIFYALFLVAYIILMILATVAQSV